MDMTRRERAVRAARVLHEFLTDQIARFRYGVRARQLVHEQAEAGITPQGYRAKWLEDSIRRTLGLMREISHEFNGRFPWDAASKNDVADILRGALAHVSE